MYILRDIINTTINLINLQDKEYLFNRYVKVPKRILENRKVDKREKIEIICPICNTKFIGMTFDECPCCWAFEGWESDVSEDEYISNNRTTIREAGQNFAKGLNIWGEPIE